MTDQPQRLNTQGGTHRQIQAVCRGNVKPTKDAPFEPAVLMLSEPGLSDVIVGISVKTGLVYQDIWEYSLQEWTGCFLVND